MKLTGKQIKQLHDAMLGAFNKGDLELMVSTELEEKLDAIAGGSNLSEIIFNLIQWAERRGRTKELVYGAVSYNPQEEALLAAQRGIDGSASEPPPDSYRDPDEPPTEAEQPDNPYAFAYSAQQLGGLAVNAAVRLNPVHTAILHLLQNENRPLVTVKLTNRKTNHLRLRVMVDVEGYSRTATQTAPLAPGDSSSIDLFPAFDAANIASVNELTAASVRVQVEDLADGTKWVDQTLPLQLLALNSAPLSAKDPSTEEEIDQTRYLGVFVTPNDPELDAFLNTAAKLLPPHHQFDGYQAQNIFPQVQALYDALAARGAKYVDSTLDFNPAAEAQRTQRVRLPRQVLSAGTANCLDGTLLFASLLTRIGIDAAIIVVPQHAMVAWAPSHGSDNWLHLETTWIGRKSFDEAYKEGERKAKVRRQRLEETGDERWYRRWPLRDLKEQGIYPISKTDGDELGRIARTLEAMGRQQEANAGSSGPSTTVNTGGGAYVAGSVQVGGDFVGRGKVTGQSEGGASDQQSSGGKSISDSSPAPATGSVDYPLDLLDALASGSLVPFVGAGMSIGAGLPGWYDLISELAQRSGQQMPPAKWATGDSLMAIAQTYVNQNNLGSLVRFLKDELDTTGKQPTEAHRALAQLPVNLVFTANYDDLLEQAFRAAGKRVAVVVRDGDIPFMESGANRVNIVKLYGDLNQPETVVLAQAQYERFFQVRPEMVKLLDVELGKSTMLYLGWSQTDPYFNLVIGQMLNRYRDMMRTGYAALFDVPDTQVAELRRKHIQLVELPPDSDKTRQLAAWLAGLRPDSNSLLSG